MHTSTVLLIDDHALFRAGLRMMLESALPGIQVQESESLERMLHTEGCDHLHLVLLDIHLQGMNGIDGIALVIGACELRAQRPSRSTDVCGQRSQPAARPVSLDDMHALRCPPAFAQAEDPRGLR